jgi:hypothetical protein
LNLDFACSWWSLLFSSFLLILSVTVSQSSSPTQNQSSKLKKLN